ncbi:RNA polymerase sigma factor [Solirubrum puertoriconensis]|uniref:RNA polymerase sigma factor n=1 Tax=Solirubrum puertoriconensis TaxID=1751427 RepID=UPI00098F51CF|nr:sigma-70 family RNA polymerase sigma factor [Solirubrum puertoriconensis]
MSALAAAFGGTSLGRLVGGLSASSATAEPEVKPAPTRPLQPSGRWSEAELIDACLEGSRVAQKELYTRYASRMLAVCARYSQTTFEAEDVLQEGFVTVFSNLRHFRRECPLEFWVRRIMINAALRQHRRNAPMLAVTESEYPEAIADEELILSNYSFDELLKMIQELAPRYRMVFNLFAIEGYGHKEIGDMLGISEGTSKSQYSRARAILKAKLERLDQRCNDTRFQ